MTIKLQMDVDVIGEAGYYVSTRGALASPEGIAVTLKEKLT